MSNFAANIALDVFIFRDFRFLHRSFWLDGYLGPFFALVLFVLIFFNCVILVIFPCRFLRLNISPSTAFTNFSNVMSFILKATAKGSNNSGLFPRNLVAFSSSGTSTYYVANFPKIILNFLTLFFQFPSSLNCKVSSLFLRFSIA